MGKRGKRKFLEVLFYDILMILPVCFIDFPHRKF